MRPQVAIFDELLSRARAQPDDPDTYTWVVDRDLGVASETRLDADLRDCYSPGGSELPISCASAESSAPLREVLL